MNIFESFYFIIVTLTTLGYGDYYPVEPLMRIFLTCLLMIYIGIISGDITKLSSILSIVSPYDTDYGLKNHIVVLGEFHPENLKKMLLNFYSEYNSFEDTGDFKTLIVKDEEPSIEILSILDDIKLMNNVRFLKAKLNKLDWVHKANLKKAHAILAFADKPKYMSEDEFENIQESILYICKNIKIDIMRENENQEIHMYLHQNINFWNINDTLNPSNVVNPNRYRHYFLANMIENNQLHNFLSHIVYGFNSGSNYHLPNFVNKNTLLTHHTKAFKQRITKIKLSNYFVGWTFSEVKNILYFSYAYPNLLYMIKSKKDNSTAFCRSLVMLAVEIIDQKEDLKYKRKKATNTIEKQRKVINVAINEPDYISKQIINNSFFNLYRDFYFNFFLF